MIPIKEGAPGWPGIAPLGDPSVARDQPQDRVETRRGCVTLWCAARVRFARRHRWSDQR